jgi:hypothetical protein
MFRRKWKAAAAAAAAATVHWHHVPCIDVAVAPATHTCPIVPRGLRRGVLELRNPDVMIVTVIMMSQGSGGVAHRGAGVGVGGGGAGVVIARLSAVNGGGGRSRGRAVVLDWP